MRIVLLVVVLAVVALVVFWAARRAAARRAHEAASRYAPHPDPFRRAEPGEADELRRLGPGDLVTYEGRDWTVRGSLHLDEGGSTWAEHLLDDASTKRWLSVEDAEDLEVALWEAVPLGDVDVGAPGDRTVTIRGVAYRLEERGSAAYRAEGTTGTAASGRCDYADYAAEDGRLASFERFGTSSWEVGLGRRLGPRDVTVYNRER